MNDLKLFSIYEGKLTELHSQAPQIEKTLQNLIESNLETLLGVRFLATEYSTGPIHGGRIDSLGIDENNVPVILEYKRTISENVINQGLFYLDWLMDHKRDFQWLVMDKLGKQIADQVDWSQPRLICIASDFTKYDGFAVNQINKAIELIRYRRFGEDHFMIEQLQTAKPNPKTVEVTQSVDHLIELTDGSNSILSTNKDQYASQQISYRLNNSSDYLKSLWQSVYDFIYALGDDIQIKELKYYFAFKKIKNFICLEIYPQTGVVIAYAKLNPDLIDLEPGFTRDVRKIGHYGTGDLEISMKSTEDFLKAQHLIISAYQAG